MPKSHFLISTVQVIARFAWSIVYFPLWWYSIGFLRHVSRVAAFWKEEQRSLGLAVWVRNWFVPMYGQKDFAGRVISFFIRSVQIFARGLVMVILLVLGIFFMAAWLALPLAIILATAYQLLEK